MQKLARIINKTQSDKVIGDRIEIADGFVSKLCGLIGRTELPQGGGMLLVGTTSIHTCMMSIPIDALFLDKANRIVAIDHSLRPWRIGKMRMKTCSVLELPAGTAERLGIHLEDQIEVQKLR